MQSVRVQALWTCSALVLALFASHIHAANPPPATPPPHLPIDPIKDAQVTTMAQGSDSLLRLVELACTHALGTKLTAAETGIAVRNLNIPARFDLLNSGELPASKSDVPRKIVQYESTAVFTEGKPGSKPDNLGTLTVKLDADKANVQDSGFAQRAHFGYTVNYSVGKLHTVGHVYFPEGTSLPAFRTDTLIKGKPTTYGPVTLSTARNGSVRSLTDTTVPYT